MPSKVKSPSLAKASAGKQNSKIKSARKVSAKQKVLKPVKRTIGLKVQVMDIKGKAAGTLNLPKEIFGVDVNEKLLSQAVRIYRANQRSGSAHTKSRGEVRGSTRKIYRQKGTGRARHGGVRAPIFVGGGVAFGPKKRDYSLDFPKKMKKKALFMALSEKLKEGKLVVVSGFERIEPKTKNAAKALKNLKIENGKILLVLPENLENVRKAARNIERVNILPANLVNPYEVLSNNTLLLMKDSVDKIRQTFLPAGREGLKGETK